MNDASNVNYIDDVLKKATQASAVFSQYDQEQTDKIVRAVYQAGFAVRVQLAKKAHEETGMGNWEDKVLKNVVATQYVYEDIKNLKTVGVLSEDLERGIVEIAQPMGPILCIIPVTNPTSTVMYKILSALKTRNPVIVSPSRKAVNCTVDAARICYEAALKAGAPDDCIQWLSEVSREQTQALMTHPDLALILATGGTGLVKSAYSSGTPTIGVGPGNVPIYIENSADIPFAVEQICISKLFDNGTICASEQAIIVERSQADLVKEEFIKKHAYFLTEEEIPKLEEVAFLRDKGSMSPAVVGQSAAKIAKAANLNAPDDVKLLIAPLKGAGEDHPLSFEILAPILAYYEVGDFDEAVNLCIDLNFHGGIGHTVGMYSNDSDKINKFASLMNAGRIVVNTPSSQGAVGYMFNKMSPSFTLGCGTGGKNITTDNVTARNLMNVQRIALRRENQRMMSFDSALYYDESLGAEAIEKQYNLNY
jgi:acetaldehyde dehydrogenase / alcohol dehydrogenase